jgi:hypothetical protein
MHSRLAAAVPIAMWNACWEYHKSSRTGLILVARDLQAHGAAEDVEELVDQVLVETRRRPSPGGVLMQLTLQLDAPES